MGTGCFAIRRWQRWCIAALLCLGLGCLALPARAVGVNPHLHWQTLESAHFRITFTQGHAALARHTLAVAESVRAELDPRFKWDPAGKVELVLGEVLNNVVEHAYGGKLDGLIVLTCRTAGGGLVFDVRDAGQ